MSRVKIPGRFGTPDDEVALQRDGGVIWKGKLIGYVWKGQRTYSPPVSRGSRIVKYHKQIDEWQGTDDVSQGPSRLRPRYHHDRRHEVIRRLIDRARQNEYREKMEV